MCLFFDISKRNLAYIFTLFQQISFHWKYDGNSQQFLEETCRQMSELMVKMVTDWPSFGGREDDGKLWWIM